jgi:Cys/Met metabolism PLP-dependent enzyme
VWIESPTNLHLAVYDIAAISCEAHARGVLLVVNNTFTAPPLQLPFELGADTVVRSVTKYPGERPDLIQGAVVAKDSAVFELIKFYRTRPAPPFAIRLLANAAQPEDRGAAGMKRLAENAAATGGSRWLIRSAERRWARVGRP